MVDIDILLDEICYFYRKDDKEATSFFFEYLIWRKNGMIFGEGCQVEM